MGFHAEFDDLAEFTGAAPILADLPVAAADSLTHRPLHFDLKGLGILFRPFSGDADAKARIFLPRSRDNSVHHYMGT
jgi:hypothetical protein